MPTPSLARSLLSGSIAHRLQQVTSQSLAVCGEVGILGTCSRRLDEFFAQNEAVGGRSFKLHPSVTITISDIGGTRISRTTCIPRGFLPSSWSFSSNYPPPSTSCIAVLLGHFVVFAFWLHLRSMNPLHPRRQTRMTWGTPLRKVVKLCTDAVHGRGTKPNNSTVKASSGRHNCLLYEQVAVLPSQVNPIDLLSCHAMVAAAHESRDGSYAPKCKPGTRTEIINRLLQWLESGEKSFMWISGPAGGGKTCILRGLAERLKQSGTLAASYFFCKHRNGLDNDIPFVSTLALQLTESIPALARFVEDAIRRKPSIFSKALEVQLDELIVQPLALLAKHCAGACQGFPRVILVDALDECRDPQQRLALLRLCATISSISIPNIRIILSSRLENDLSTEFSQEPLRTCSSVLSLGDFPASHDIRFYLCDEFARIREHHPANHTIPKDWPSESTIDLLVRRASSQFVFASTVIRFVDNPRRNPVALLNDALNIQNAMHKGTNPLDDLDALYQTIIHPAGADLALLKHILHLIIFVRHPWGNPPVYHADALDLFAGLERGTTSMVLSDVHSIVDTTRRFNRRIQYHHLSAEDYLLSPRSGDMFQPKYVTYQWLRETSIRHLQNHFSSPPGAIPPWLIKYACAYLEIGLAHLTKFSLWPNSQTLGFHPAYFFIAIFVEAFEWDISISLKTLEKFQHFMHEERCGDKCLALCLRLVHILEHKISILAIFDHVAQSITERLAQLPALRRLVISSCDPDPVVCKPYEGPFALRTPEQLLAREYVWTEDQKREIDSDDVERYTVCPGGIRIEREGLRAVVCVPSTVPSVEKRRIHTTRRWKDVCTIM